MDTFTVDGHSPLMLAANADVVRAICELTPNLFARRSPDHPSQLEFFVQRALDPSMKEKLAALLPYITRCRIELQQAEQTIAAAIDDFIWQEAGSTDLLERSRALLERSKLLASKSAQDNVDNYATE